MFWNIGREILSQQAYLNGIDKLESALPYASRRDHNAKISGPQTFILNTSQAELDACATQLELWGESTSDCFRP